MKKNPFKFIYIFIVGFFGFSMLGQHIVLNIFHFPFSFMEIYFLPLIYIYRKRVVYCLKKLLTKPSKGFLAIEFLLLIGFIIGLILTFQLSIIVNYRTIIYMLLIIIYMIHYDVKINLKIIFWVNLFAILGDLFYINIVSIKDINSSINCIAIGLCILSAFLDERYIIGCFVALLSAFLGVTSGFRIGIIVSILVLLEAIVYTMLRRDRKSSLIFIVRRFLAVIIILLIVTIILNNYEKIIGFVAEKMDMSSFAIFRVIERMKALFLLDFSASQDLGRIKIFQYPIERFFVNIIPRGLIGETIGEYPFYIDIPILYLYDLFGSVGSLVILFIIFKKTIRKIKVRFVYMQEDKGNLYIRNNDFLTILAVLMVPLLIFLETINGSFVVIVFQGVETAAVLGILMKNHKGKRKV